MPELADESATRARTIAFYLPQFQPVPENDAWWGHGFSEWRNVAKAKPLFPGHYQPHLPGDLGFYDLRLPEVRAVQAQLAGGYGIDGFCYYHYWFHGRRVLHRTFDEVLGSGEPDFPFCLAWANENWTRQWDGGSQQVLIPQHYDERDDLEHFDYLLNAFRDPRYIRIGGRPLFLVYRVQEIPEPRRTFDLWRERARAEGIGDLYILKFDTHGDFVSPEHYGCDAAAEFVPHGVGENIPRAEVAGAHPGNRLFRYVDVATYFAERESPGWVRHPCVIPGWDNSPRRHDGGVTAIVENSPELYEWWLARAHDRARENAPESLVFINAWNEWAEGAHLEPDEERGRAYLEATSRVLGASPYREQRRAADLPPATFSDLYLNLYTDYMALQSVHTEFLAALERRIAQDRDVANRELALLQAQNERLAHALRSARSEMID